MKNDLLLLIDGENLLHRAFHKFEKLKSSSGKPTGAIFGFFRMLHSMIFRFDPKHVVVTFDNGKSKHRLELLPEYKSHRKNIKMDYNSLHKQKRVIRRILSSLNIPYIFDKPFEYDYEGDDYIALIKHLYKGKIVIASGDKDFCQLICERVKLFNTSKDTIISTHNCKEVMGFSSLECVDYLCLVGDSSDDIPGYPGIGPKKARSFLDAWKSIQNFLNHTENEHPGIDKDLLNETYTKCRSLIDLYYFIKNHTLNLSSIPIVYGKYNKTRLLFIFDKYDLNSFKTPEFLSIFKKLKVWHITPTNPGK